MGQSLHKFFEHHEYQKYVEVRTLFLCFEVDYVDIQSYCFWGAEGVS